MERAVRVEAGHRCAIPTCRATSGLQIHHIVEWSQARKHEFENLLLLCANCHARVTNGEIERKAVFAYKANLSLLSSRYGDLERRILERFVKDPHLAEVVIDLSHEVLLDYLITDGMLVSLGPGDRTLKFVLGGDTGDSSPEEVYMGPMRWGLTAQGRELVEHLRQAQQID
jgi:hypothetical protein